MMTLASKLDVMSPPIKSPCWRTVPATVLCPINYMMVICDLWILSHVGLSLLWTMALGIACKPKPNLKNNCMRCRGVEVPLWSKLSSVCHDGVEADISMATFLGSKISFNRYQSKRLLNHDFLPGAGGNSIQVCAIPPVHQPRILVEFGRIWCLGTCTGLFCRSSSMYKGKWWESKVLLDRNCLIHSTCIRAWLKEGLLAPASRCWISLHIHREKSWRLSFLLALCSSSFHWDVYRHKLMTEWMSNMKIMGSGK